MYTFNDLCARVVFGKIFISIFINLRRSRDCLLIFAVWVCVCFFAGVCVCARVCVRLSLRSVRFEQLLRCARQRIANIIKEYIVRNNMQVGLIRFH